MNKNTMRRQREIRKVNCGKSYKPGTKKKKQPFPSKGGPTMEEQRAIFYGN